ncbi:hybrid sensor histidine kinase/response regulator [Polyangium aurulentum]|uniref:hybrid sensor histidine kinase/response regulator n=1 Tax=Polyangium aurulentum TaxID=2567896 RepID=UPI0010ADF8F1|nr:hybrid sensor histidine kinase/response regulator [Polyangium aurulentum]UQA63396.1 hybrid sensor histidine kinase/response regulator [Polyangium aurulentum]
MTGTTTKILAVDDVDANLAALEALLARPGVELLKARSGTEALELLLVEDVALALVDVQMPEMDGFELAELMRGSPRTRHVPIIFLTAGPYDPSRLFQGYEAGAVDFLHKPLDPHALRSKVEVFTELKRQRAELSEHVELLRQALHLNATFTAVLGHDLRNPLGAIVVGAELIQRKTEEESLLKVAARIKSSAMRMARLIEQLLDLARARSGSRIPVHPVPLDLAELCGRAIGELESASGARLPAISSRGDTKGRWDEDRLMQVLSNLIGNAVRHGDPKQPIAVTVDGTSSAEIVIAISNGGVIPGELLPHIFEPFRSGQSVPPPGRKVRDREGLGLGLYIARQMVEAHGGTIRVRSSAESGTTFEVRLPREATAVESGEAGAAFSGG